MTMDGSKQICKAGICDINGCEVVVVPCPNVVPALGMAALGLTIVFVVLVAWIIKRGHQ